MNNLFSIFDPSTGIFFSLNWFSLFLLPMFIPNKFYFNNSRYLYLYNNMNKFIMSTIKTNINKNQLKNMMIFTILFNTILLANLTSLFPYFFNSTSHINITLGLALPLWLSMTLKNWLNSPSKPLSHLLPLSTPIILSPFMISIEIISLLIRPFTLAIRLMANMIAGHMLMSLLSSTLYNPISIYILSSITLNTLYCLEIAVAMIQSYVFITLMSLYLSENS
uniref:ATP synthase subunit a n=1 Tax=Blattisocius keegani TaxID=2337216 RepID=A0A4Y5QDE4_9ACAR|nr:ATP synthase F0 subunit 6 [Blattisocius keegani]